MNPNNLTSSNFRPASNDTPAPPSISWIFITSGGGGGGVSETLRPSGFYLGGGGRTQETLPI